MKKRGVRRRAVVSAVSIRRCEKRPMASVWKRWPPVVSQSLSGETAIPEAAASSRAAAARRDGACRAA